MKKLKLHELVIVAIICILICLEFAIISREIIGISGDFIAAGATLFASFVAYLIFIDWREEYQIKKLEEYHDKILIEADLLGSAFKNIDSVVLSGRMANSFGIHYDGDDLQEDHVDIAFNQSYEEIRLELRKIHRIISEYEVFLKNFKHKETARHVNRVEELRKRTFILVMVSRKYEGVISSKPLKKFTANILVKQHKLDILVFDLNRFAYENITDFFYKVFKE